MDEIMKNRTNEAQAVKQFLRDHLDKEKDDLTMNDILRDIGRYYDADRAYIFEADRDRKTFSNTFEWCREGVDPEIGNLQNIPVEKDVFFLFLILE